MNTLQTLTALPADTLDKLWYEAEQLGRIEVDHRLGDKSYRVQIRFERRSGTIIWAEGNDINIAFALGKAINEARELGAGVAG